MMNEAYQAHDGLPPELFPRHIPTYTGAAALTEAAGSGCVCGVAWIAVGVAAR